MRKSILCCAALLCLLLGASAQAAGTADLQTFTQAYREAVVEKLPGAVARIAENGDILVTLEGEEYNINPANAYADYVAGGGADMEGYVAYYAGVMASLVLQENDSTLTRDNLRAAMKTQDYVDYILENTEATPVYEAFMEGVLVLYMADFPQTVRAVNENELAESGIDPEEVAALARENLIKCLPQAEFYEAGANIALVYLDGVYESSLLLLDPNDIADFAGFGIEGDLIVAAPARDAFFVTGSAHKEDVEALRVYARQLFEETGYQVTDKLLRWNGEGYEVYE